MTNNVMTTSEPVMANSIEFLKRVSLFSNLDDKDLDKLLSLSDRRSYKKDNVVLYSGGRGIEIFIVLKGNVKVSLEDENSKEIILKVLHEGDFFGEMSLFGDSKISANVETLTPCEFLVIHQDDIKNLVIKEPHVAIKLLSVLSNRLRSTNELLRSIVFDDVKQRVLKILLDPSRNIVESKDIKSIERPTVKVIAAMAGTTRESASRVLNELHRDGHIHLKKDEIELVLL